MGFTVIHKIKNPLASIKAGIPDSLSLYILLQIENGCRATLPIRVSQHNPGPELINSAAILLSLLGTPLVCRY